MLFGFLTAFCTCCIRRVQSHVWQCGPCKTKKGGKTRDEKKKSAKVQICKQMQTSFPKRNVVFMCSCVLESKSLPEVCRFCLTRCVHIFALQGAPIEAFGNENAKAKVFGASAQPFSIHCDDGSALPVQQQHLQQQQQQQREKLQLHPSITALRQPSIPPPPIVLDAG